MRRALPILVAAALAVSTAACQQMMGKDRGTAGGTQTGAATGTTGTAATTATAENQALAPDMVRDIQRKLSQRGYDTGPADGLYGDSTQSALKKFQRDQNIRATGQIDQQTLAALGMGQTARGGQASEYTPMERRGTR